MGFVKGGARKTDTQGGRESMLILMLGLPSRSRSAEHGKPPKARVKETMTAHANLGVSDSIQRLEEL
jgi:hypothetical protein